MVKYFDLAAARLAGFEYYNKERIHSSLEYITLHQWQDNARRIS
ncbi:transposase [Anaerosalibacter massiliensis]|uniref:Uncharacterized protein n=1 Tax=Anaerosalibacter massiliensis TaxID=1347392 RepID=A0A9X2MIZ6_9FIRM|nr:transposase [Anaerosalibacter massiliensis]MCR2044589.1 hypothetical protein [Anaerosalibacter massiliensis]